MGKIYREAYEANEYDFNDIMATQPNGDVTLHGTYTKLPNGYAQIMYIDEVKTTQLKNLWLANLASIKNTMISISVGVENRKEFIDRLNKADANVETTNNDKLSEGMDRSEDAYIRLMAAIQGANGNVPQQPLRVYIRLMVFAKTKAELEQSVKDIKNDYTNFHFSTLRSFQFSEWRSMWLAANKQFETLDSHQLGLSMSAADLGGAYWADFAKLDDPYGTIIGTSVTGGIVNFNAYLKDGRFRTRPFMAIMGSPSFGKSTLQKMLVEDAIKRGHRVVVFDPSLEYGGLSEYAGGITVKLDGTNGMINPLQVYPTVTDETGENVDVVGSFSQHIEKLKSMYGFMSENLSQSQRSDDMIALDNLITNFYIARRMWTKNPTVNPDEVRIFIPVAEYPVLADFVVYLRGVMRSRNGRNAEDVLIREQSLLRLVSTFETMVNKHGSMFNGTTTIPDLSKEQFVRYDVSNLIGTKNVFNTMTYVALSREQPNINNHGKFQRLRRNRNEITAEQVPHTVLVLDEAQNYIQMENAYNLKFIVTLMEQMRKNYAALMLAMPTISDLVVADAGTSDPQAKEFYKNVNKMFDLLQYRFFFNLPDNNLDALDKVLGDSITQPELKQIANLEKGKTVLNIQGDHNIYVNVTPTKKQLARFHGGD